MRLDIALPTDLSMGRDPYYWLQSAHTNFRGADLLFSEFERARPESSAKLSSTEPIDVSNYEHAGERLYYPAFMLMGLAIETGLKGILVAIEPNVVGMTKLEKKLKNHNLLSLAKDCKLSLSSEEEDILRLLEKFVMWAGRYPIPTNPSEFSIFGSMLEFPKDFERTKAVYVKIIEVLAQQKPFFGI